jgi:hypothetical protein
MCWRLANGKVKGKITNSRVKVPTPSWFAVILPRNKAAIRSLLNIDKLRKAFSIGSYHDVCLYQPFIISHDSSLTYIHSKIIDRLGVTNTMAHTRELSFIGHGKLAAHVKSCAANQGDN